MAGVGFKPRGGKENSGGTKGLGKRRRVGAIGGMESDGGSQSSAGKLGGCFAQMGGRWDQVR